jgi:F0F1-type ATP synthase membrane subunit b/b'
MTESLTDAGYQQTKDKLARLQQRLAQLERRTDLTTQHHSEARRSYQEMISQYIREIKLYEAAHPQLTPGGETQPTRGNSVS